MYPHAVCGILMQFWQCKPMAVGITQFATQNGRPPPRTLDKFTVQVLNPHKNNMSASMYTKEFDDARGKVDRG